MRSGWVALVLLIFYLILVFVVFRFLDLILWCQHGIPSTEIVDPFLLSVRQLKKLLEIRGVSYTGYVEKKELVDLVEASAEVVKGELDELGEGEVEERSILTTPSSSQFSGAAHLYEEVEDTKDSVWLVHVVGKDSLLDDYTWRLVRNHLAPFAIRTGVFDCRLDTRLCKNKGWTQPLLLLAMPRGTKPKDKVILRTCQYKRVQAIMEWLREELSLRVKKVSSREELEQDWLKTSSSSNSSVTGASASEGVKVLLLTHLVHPPLFLAALSIKFTGRITFGIFNVKREDEEAGGGKVPRYLVITPERTVVYGRRRLEHFNLTAMDAFLKVVRPELNDLFLCSLILLNMFAILQLLQMEGGSWVGLLAAGMWTVVAANLALFGAWLCVCGALRWPLLAAPARLLSALLRLAALSHFGAQLRADLTLLLRCPRLALFSLLVFGRLALRRLPRPRHHPSPGWWEMDCLFRVPSAASPPLDPEEGLLIERLAVPAFWLTPITSPDYIRHLKVWKFMKKIKKDTPEAVETLMDGAEDGIVTGLARGELRLRIEVVECAICLERYRSGVSVCGLPCGHNYHHKCILVWLQRDNHHCPICRWPAYKAKHL